MISTCRPTLVVDPILWLPMTRMERSQVLRWRLGWLPGGKPRPCPFHPKTNLSRAHVTDCLQIHRRLHASWAVRWPAICLILFELDHIFHNEDVPPAPPHIGTSLVEWLHR
ncbi:hypothetical protein BD408DRAFT_408140 [Parasitella parasitica]|nr:hypothetical protein BD408DRAFT_408140 [Parasitella parasitica]